MSKNVITVEATDTIRHTNDLMTDYGLSIVPVVDEGRLVGVVTDRDVKRASPSDASLLDIQRVLSHMSRLEVGAIMTRYPIAVHVDVTIEEAAETLLQHKISGAPVVDDEGRIQGGLTKNELFKALIALTGLKKRGVLFGFLLQDRPGSIKAITDVIRRHNARLLSLLASYDKAPEGFRHVFVRVFDIDRKEMPKLTEELRETGKLLYIIDHRENIRQIFAD